MVKINLLPKKPKEYYIYGLFDPGGELRYIGQTSLSLDARLKTHISDARRVIVRGTGSNHRCNWIFSLLRKGTPPYISLLQTLYSIQDLNNAEMYWIKYFKDQGCELTNSTIGGQGSRGYRPTPEIIERKAAKMRGRKLSPEHIQKISDANKGQVSHFKGKRRTEENCRRISEGRKGKKHSEYAKFKMSLAHKGKPSYWKGKRLPEEVRVKISETVSKILKGRKVSEETREKLRVSNIKANPGIPIKDQNNVIYRNASEAAKILKISRSGIYNVLSGKQKTIRGFSFIKVEND